MAMESSKNETTLLPPPPSIIMSLRTGFDTIAGHITAILFPLVLDLFLWLGPHLSVSQLFLSTLSDVKRLFADTGVVAADIQSLDQMQTSLNQVNIFSALRTFPIGVSSLISSKSSIQTPLGAPLTFQVDTLVHFYAGMFLFIIAGWVLGGLYFRWIASLVLTSDSKISVGHAVAQTLVYSLIWSLLFWILGMPAAFLLYLLFMLNPLIGQGVLLFMGFLSMWLIVPIFFSSLGMFVRKQNAVASIIASFQTARFTMPSSSLFVLTILMIGIGLNFLWAIPSDDSWLTLIGILGHAFVTTALLASSFAYYRDMTVWIQTVLDRMRSSLPQQQA